MTIFPFLRLRSLSSSASVCVRLRFSPLRPGVRPDTGADGSCFDVVKAVWNDGRETASTLVRESC